MKWGIRRARGAKSTLSGIRKLKKNRKLKSSIAREEYLLRKTEPISIATRAAQGVAGIGTMSVTGNQAAAIAAFAGTHALGYTARSMAMQSINRKIDHNPALAKKVEREYDAYLSKTAEKNRRTLDRMIERADRDDAKVRRRRGDNLRPKDLERLSRNAAVRDASRYN